MGKIGAVLLSALFMLSILSILQFEPTEEGEYSLTYNHINKFTGNENNSTSEVNSDAWLTLELISWQGNTSTTWDTDGTDMDVQFQICIDLDGESDGISPQCTWTDVWNNTLNLSNAWQTTFDLIEDNTTLNITIECWDNDDDSDEWNNGPDACDMNPDDDEWRLYYEVNWSTITTETFSGDGSLGNDTQWGNAESVWKVTVSYYGDEDNDGISDHIDLCSNTINEYWNPGQSNGCAWAQVDFDDDGMLNGDDPCPNLANVTLCSFSGNYIQVGSGIKHVDIANNPLGEMQWDVSPDGGELVVDPGQLGGYSEGGGPFILDLNDFYELSESDIVTGRIIDLDVASFTFSKSVLYSPTGKYLAIGIEGKYGVEPEVRIVNLQNQSSRVVENAELYPHSFSSPGFVLLSVAGTSSWYDLNNSEILDASQMAERRSGLNKGISVSHRNDGQTGFRIANTSSGQEQLVYHSQSWMHDMLIPDDGKSVLVAAYDEVWNPKTFYDKSVNSSLNIYEFSTGKVTELPLPSYLDGEGYFRGVKISENGLRIIVHSSYYNTPEPEFIVYERDLDSDGVIDSRDECPSQFGLVEFMGCATQTTDTDRDGVVDNLDVCPNTNQEHNVDVNGCSEQQLDSDNDGVSDASDYCPNTPVGDSVGLSGCSTSQIDTDSDGIYDAQDNCPSTPGGTTVDSAGCAPNDVVDLDSDGDGVRDSVDTCPNSATGIIVDQTGCEVEKQINEENDATEDVSGEESFSTILCGGCCFILILLAIGSSSTEKDGKDKSVLVKPVVELSSNFTEETDPEHQEWLKSFFEELGLNDSHEDDDVSLLEEKVNSPEENLSHLEMESKMLALEQDFQTREQHSSSQLLALQQELIEMRAMMLQSDEERRAALDQILAMQSQTDNDITLQDSVVAGDALVGSTKIEQQVVHNDPEAIIRAFKELKAMFDEDKN